MVHFKINRLPKIHIVNRYLATCSLFDIHNDGKGLDFFIEAKNEVDINSLPVEFNNGYVSLVIGAMHGTKQMPVEKLIELCNKINIPVLIQGGPNDKAGAERILRETQNKNVINTCGVYNLQQSASLIRQAKLVITHDTGLMHIAAAYKKRIVSLWGNTIPEFGMYPYVPEELNITFEVIGLPCRPCSKIGFQKCPKKHFRCMNYLDIEEISKTVLTLFSK